MTYSSRTVICYERPSPDPSDYYILTELKALKTGRLRAGSGGALPGCGHPAPGHPRRHLVCSGREVAGACFKGRLQAVGHFSASGL